jgi:hypothetical protein
MESQLSTTFFNLFQEYIPRLKSGITKNRKKPIPVGRRGGRVRAFVMTEYYEYCFQTLQSEQKRIPENLFHSSVYNDELTKKVLFVQQYQRKYELIPVEEVWTQSETRRQIEPYRREYTNQETYRAIHGDDLRLLVAWWWDMEIGIVNRIKQYNKTLQLIPFHYNKEMSVVLKPKNCREKRKREDDVELGVFKREKKDIQTLLSKESQFQADSLFVMESAYLDIFNDDDRLVSLLTYALDCEYTSIM